MIDLLRKIFEKLFEGGYTRVPHFVLEALTACKLNGTQKSICLHLIRCTYGWGKIAEAISLNDFTQFCQSERSWIKEQVQDLVRKRVIIKFGTDHKGTNIYMFNHRITEWDKSVIDLETFLKNHNYDISDVE